MTNNQEVNFKQKIDALKQKGIPLYSLDSDFCISESLYYYLCCPKDKLAARIQEAYECGLLSVKNLEDGKYYAGYCRNAVVAVWDAPRNRFIYMRYKFGDTFAESIAPVEFDDGSDIFVPVKEIEPLEHHKIDIPLDKV
jgi:hypothetical protein